MQANRQQWCGISGWSSREFDRNLGLGFPARKQNSSRGEAWLIDTRLGIAWIVAQALGEQGDGTGPLDERTERARLLRHQANLAALTERERRGELLPAGEVVEGWQAAIGRARSLLLGMPPAAADQVVSLARRHADDAQAIAAVRERLAEMIHDALAELANTAVEDVEDAAAVAAA
jgi:phage terminase Nu1 subunit (DNA packaging protein)